MRVEEGEEHRLFFRLVNHCPASWMGESMKQWVNSACDLLLLGSDCVLARTPAVPYNPTSPLPACSDLSFLMPQRPGAWLAFSSSFFYSFATHCISTRHLWQKPKKSNVKLQCASYSLVLSTSWKKKEGCHHFGNLPKHSANLSDSSFWWQYTIFKHWCFI